MAKKARKDDDTTARLDDEQRAFRVSAERRFIPEELRWVASHPFLSQGEDDAQKYANRLEWRRAAKRHARFRCPSAKALNMLAWAISKPEKFWQEYNRAAQTAIAKAEAEREKRVARMDTVEKITEARASLDAHLAKLGLSRHTMPPPQFPAPTTPQA